MTKFDVIAYIYESDERQGLANLSCDTLSRARSFVLAHLLQTLPLRDSHLKAFLTAVIEMELEMISESNHDCLSVYLNKLKPQNPQLDLVLERRGFVKDSMVLSEEISQTVRFGRSTDDDLTKLSLQEVFKRQSAVSCISTLETGLDVHSNAIRYSSETESDSSFLEQQTLDGAPSSVGYVTNSFPNSEISAFCILTDKNDVGFIVSCK